MSDRKLTRRSFSACAGLAALPFPTMLSDDDDPVQLRIDLDTDHSLVAEYVGVVDDVLAADQLLYVGRFSDVEWRSVLSADERAVIFDLTVTPSDRPESPPTAAEFGLADGTPPLRLTTDADWLGDPSVEPVPDAETVYWMTDAPIHHGKGSALAFPVASASEFVTLRYERESVTADLEVPVDV